MVGLVFLRAFFVFAAAGVGFSVMRAGGLPIAGGSESHIESFFGILGLAVVLVIVDMISPRKRVEWISSVYFGIFVGLVMTYVLGLAIQPLFPESVDASQRAVEGLQQANIMLVLGICLCYLCTSFLIQTRDDFRFVIPYVEFQKNLKGSRPLVLDTSVVIDGRIADIAETKLIDSTLIIPRFVIDELQNVADSTDRGRRMRGRRGLDILSRLQKTKAVELQIDETDLPVFQGQPVDLKLVALSKHLEGKLVTNDYNLNKVARLHGIDVINLNDLASAMRPIFLPGEVMEVDVVRSGEEANQGVGFIEDGTMIVIDGGRSHIGERVRAVVTSVLQTSAGKLIFARFDGTLKKLTGTTMVLENNTPITPPATATAETAESPSNRYKPRTGTSASYRKKM
ncbi:MAG: PIN/TRAM domain-containing protein [Thermoguttaceae bacterium]